MPNPWVSLRRDQLIPVNKAVNKKNQLEKWLEEEDMFLVAEDLSKDGTVNR
jgi:hypothetical protein